MTVSREEIKNRLWVNKYAPSRVSECILPDRIKNPLEQMIRERDITNLLFAGPAGCGKTTCARAIASELSADVLFINASMEGRIETLRNEIKQFASTVSMSNADVPKIVILDEVEGSSTSQAFQPALRAFMEEFSDNCRFILTCNFKNRIIEPIHSRCSVFDFDFGGDKKEVALLQAKLFKRVCAILDNEGVEYDKKVVAYVVNQFYPDFRRLLNELQKYSMNGGKIDSGILSRGAVSGRINELMGYMADKDFRAVRKWVSNNSDIGDAQLFRSIYELLDNYLEKSSIPEAIVLIGDYQDKATRALDREINFVAFCVELMATCSFKQ